MAKKTPEQIEEEIARLKTVCGPHVPNVAPSHRREDIFPPDHPSDSMQGAMEVVRLGRVSGTKGVKRL